MDAGLSTDDAIVCLVTYHNNAAIAAGATDYGQH
jgi:hypothetical protein